MSIEPVEHTAPPRLASDPRRNWIAFGIGAAATALIVFAYTLLVHEHFSLNLVINTSFVFWIAYSTCFLVLTQLTFRRATPEELKSWMQTTSPHRFRQRLAADLSGAGPTVTAQWCVLALISVALVSLSPTLVKSPLANGLSFAVVISSWLVTVETYAVHYARLNATTGGIQFPGDNPPMPVFMDYVYLAAQISTTFSSSDVSIVTTRARVVVTGQTLIAFAFNTFIIAFLISIIFLS